MRIERGDGWELRCGDCLDPETGLASLEAVDHVITDPPYEAEAHTKRRRCRDAQAGRLRAAPLPFPAVTELQRRVTGALMSSVVKRWCLVFCQVEASQRWAESFSLEYIRTMVWDKPNGAPQFTGDRPGMGYESIVVLHAEGAKRWNAGGKRGVYRFPTEGRGCHPTQKPIALMESLVLDFTDPGELICDPFAGSGTTGVAALKHGRRFIGWEKDPDFFDVAVRRLQGRPAKVEGQEELFG